MNYQPNSLACCAVLSHLVLGTDEAHIGKEVFRLTASFHEPDWQELQHLANMHHVVIRALPRLSTLLERNGNRLWADYFVRIVATERARIAHAISFLKPICTSLEQAGSVVVMKSLDHWPDLGSDLDLFTDGDPAAVISIMSDLLHATMEPRSWGDRLANKWNFALPGLPELVEVHVRRLGQMGEQKLIGEALIARAITVERGDEAFRVPAPEDRIVISTLQRMFRHFYMRICDIAEISQLIADRAVDFGYLCSLGKLSGLWDGLATYLNIIRGYARQYGRSLELPSFVLSGARFANDEVRFRKSFLRIPILPHCAQLYAAELRKLVFTGQISNSLRLSLMPALATAAALREKIAGSDSGIW